jgi:hypothetical protein
MLLKKMVILIFFFKWPIFANLQKGGGGGHNQWVFPKKIKIYQI